MCYYISKLSPGINLGGDGLLDSLVLAVGLLECDDLDRLARGDLDLRPSLDITLNPFLTISAHLRSSDDPRLDRPGLGHSFFRFNVQNPPFFRTDIFKQIFLIPGFSTSACFCQCFPLLLLSLQMLRLLLWDNF